MTPAQALTLVKETSYTKFDATVEVHMRMGLDPRQADQMVRDVVVLPNGLGKTVRVLVFAQGEGAPAPRKPALILLPIAMNGSPRSRVVGPILMWPLPRPDMMGKAGRLGRVLGPRGLMPNPKAGTVVPAEDLPRVIHEAKAGRVEFRLDKTANIHVPIGKVSFTVEKLYENLAALMEAIKKASPSAAKGIYIRRMTLTSTMGPGLKVDAPGPEHGVAISYSHSQLITSDCELISGIIASSPALTEDAGACKA